MAFEIEFAEEAYEHLRRLSVRQRSVVLPAIREQLIHTPLEKTRNRKPLRPNPLAPWVLRVGELRVYYEVNAKIVTVRAIGVKIRNKVTVGGVEVELS